MCKYQWKIYNVCCHRGSETDLKCIESCPNKCKNIPEEDEVSPEFGYCKTCRIRLQNGQIVEKYHTPRIADLYKEPQALDFATPATAEQLKRAQNFDYEQHLLNLSAPPRQSVQTPPSPRKKKKRGGIFERFMGSPEQKPLPKKPPNFFTKSHQKRSSESHSVRSNDHSDMLGSGLNEAMSNTSRRNTPAKVTHDSPSTRLLRSARRGRANTLATPGSAGATDKVGGLSGSIQIPFSPLQSHFHVEIPKTPVQEEPEPPSPTPIRGLKRNPFDTPVPSSNSRAGGSPRPMDLD